MQTSQSEQLAPGSLVDDESGRNDRQDRSRRQRDLIGCGLMVLILLGLVPVSIAAQVLGWSLGPLGLNMFASLSDGGFMAWASVLQGGMFTIPLSLLALFWRGARYRAVFQTWSLAIIFLLVMIPIRYVVPTASQVALILQLVVVMVYLLFVLALVRGRPELSPTTSGMWPAVLVSALFAYPWFAWGALGSPLDIVLGLVLSLSFGVLAALIVAQFWLLSLSTDSRGRGWDLFTGGLVICVTLLIMASGFGFNGTQVLLLCYLPAMGWVAMALTMTGQPDAPARNWPVLALFLGLTVAMPTLLMDTDTAYFPFATEAGEGLIWGFRSVAWALPVASVLGMLALVFRKQLRSWRSDRSLAGAAVVLWGLGLAVYLVAGQPGFYGDRLFVVLKDQADVSQAANMADYDSRRQYVYRTLVDHAVTTQADLRAVLDGMRVRYTPYYLVNALEVDGGLLHRLRLSGRPEVDRIMPSPVLRPLPAGLEPGSGTEAAPGKPEWNLTNIGADRVWSELGVRGVGIVVGQSDSGVQLDHPDLADGYRGKDARDDYNWFDPWFETANPVDTAGHGTHTLGSVLGNTVGVAPDAQWFACANLARNLGNPAKYLDCMQFMLAPFPQGGDPFRDGDPTQSAHVLNNSWGCPEDREGCDPDSLRPAVQALRAAGLFVVASAGNEGPQCGTVKDPIAIYGRVLSVGAVDNSGNVGLFSSMGPVTVDGSNRIKPDIIAPGVDVLSSTPHSTYGVASGTSMAGPHVAGVVALMWSANPALIGDIERTAEILIETARPYTGTVDIMNLTQEIKLDGQPDIRDDPRPDLPFSLGTCLDKTDTSVVPNNVAGYGLIDAYAAVKRALAEGSKNNG